MDLKNPTLLLLLIASWNLIHILGESSLITTDNVQVKGLDMWP
jgi:hypothetical protein